MAYVIGLDDGEERSEVIDLTVPAYSNFYVLAQENSRAIEDLASFAILVHNCDPQHPQPENLRELDSFNDGTLQGMEIIDTVTGLVVSVGVVKTVVKQLGKAAAKRYAFRRIERAGGNNLRGQLSSESSSSLAKGVANSNSASNVNAQDALKRKLRCLEKAQQKADRIVELPDGRIRYYGKEISATKEGPTRGASHVTEYNPKTGQVKEWRESYDYSGNVIRVHPKSNNGQVLEAPHFPPTQKEIGK